jgi:hypothetical protein
MQAKASIFDPIAAMHLWACLSRGDRCIDLLLHIKTGSSRKSLSTF